MSELWKVIAILGGAFVLGFSGAVVPGPMFAATVMHARSRGWFAGVLVSCGHALAELPMVVAIALGAGVAFASPVVARTVALAGGAVLVAMGVLSAVRPPDSPETDASAAQGGARGWLSPVLAGVWTSVSQPFWFIWWATAGASGVMFALAQSGPPGVGAFYVGHVLSDLVWFTLVAAAVGAGRRIVPPRVFRVILRVCGVALVGFGLFFAWLGLFRPEALKAPSRARDPASTAYAPGAASSLSRNARAAPAGSGEPVTAALRATRRAPASITASRFPAVIPPKAKQGTPMPDSGPAIPRTRSSPPPSSGLPAGDSKTGP